MPFVYALPQFQQVPLLTSFVTFVPQCPQKGSPAATLLAHFGHVVGKVARSAGFECTSAVLDAGGGAVGMGGVVALMASSEAPTEYAGTMRAADCEIGFPQSIQKRDIGSLSRPQKAQETRGVTVSAGRA
jgi:hypothetical protein